MNRWPTIKQIKNSKVADINRHLPDETPIPQKRAKFGNKRIEIDGYMFDSLKESRRYVELRILRIKGLIHALFVHPVFQLSVCKYEADFSFYTKDGEYVVEDVKSPATRTSTYKMKKKLMKAEKDIEIKET